MGAHLLLVLLFDFHFDCFMVPFGSFRFAYPICQHATGSLGLPALNWNLYPKARLFGGLPTPPSFSPLLLVGWSPISLCWRSSLLLCLPKTLHSPPSRDSAGNAPSVQGFSTLATHPTPLAPVPEAEQAYLFLMNGPSTSSIPPSFVLLLPHSPSLLCSLPWSLPLLHLRSSP